MHIFVCDTHACFGRLKASHKHYFCACHHHARISLASTRLICLAPHLCLLHLFGSSSFAPAPLSRHAWLCARRPVDYVYFIMFLKLVTAAFYRNHHKICAHSAPLSLSSRIRHFRATLHLAVSIIFVHALKWRDVENAVFARYRATFCVTACARRRGAPSSRARSCAFWRTLKSARRAAVITCVPNNIGKMIYRWAE